MHSIHSTHTRTHTISHKMFNCMHISTYAHTAYTHTQAHTQPKLKRAQSAMGRNLRGAKARPASPVVSIPEVPDRHMLSPTTENQGQARAISLHHHQDDIDPDNHDQNDILLNESDRWESDNNAENNSGNHHVSSDGLHSGKMDRQRAEMDRQRAEMDRQRAEMDRQRTTSHHEQGGAVNVVSHAGQSSHNNDDDANMPNQHRNVSVGAGEASADVVTEHNGSGNVVKQNFNGDEQKGYQQSAMPVAPKSAPAGLYQVCMYVCKYPCVWYVCMHVYIMHQVCVHTCVYICMYVCISSLPCLWHPSRRLLGYIR
jgi:hypothetical protein